MPGESPLTLRGRWENVPDTWFGRAVLVSDARAEQTHEAVAKEPVGEGVPAPDRTSTGAERPDAQSSRGMVKYAPGGDPL